MRPSFALWGRCGRRGGGAARVLRCEWRLHVLPRRGKGVRRRESPPPIGSVCDEMTLRVQGSQ